MILGYAPRVFSVKTWSVGPNFSMDKYLTYDLTCY